MYRLCVLLLCLAACGPASAADKYNVLFIASDDLNNDLGLYGHRLVRSPNLDRLGRQGVTFENAYCQYPVCNPSRASLMTGLYPDQTQVRSNAPHFRDFIPEVTTLPQMFRDNGYFAARVGKIYHYGVPRQIGTDGLDDPESWDGVVNPKGRDKTDEHLVYSIDPDHSMGGTLSWLAAGGSGKEQTDGIGATECIRLLEEHRDEPFFIAMGFYRPHTPYVAPRKYFEMYPRQLVRLPLAPPDDLVDLPRPAFMDRPYQLYLSEELKKKAIQAYYASITFMDAQLGRILDALERLELKDNTIVVFWSDHGYHMGEHRLWQKTTLFENSARVPLIIASPEHRETAGLNSRAVTELVDLYPTLADLCGLELPPHPVGRSLRPNLEDPAAPGKTAALTTLDVRDRVHRQEPLWPDTAGYSIRTGRWRYTEWGGGEYGAELYDHWNDRHEWTNLALAPGYQDVVERMQDLLEAAVERAHRKPAF